MIFTDVTRDSRHPFETSILAAGIVGGAFALFGGLWPTSLEVVLYDWVQRVWGIFFFGGAVMAEVGIVLKSRDIGIFLEQIGLVSFGGACATYASALLIYNFSGSFTVAVLMLLVSWASFAQWWRLERFIRAQIARGERIRMRG